MNWYLRLIPIFFFVICNCFANRAPIVEGWHQSPSRQSNYIVQKGDTLYSIAWAFDMDFRDVARLNLLKPPYHLVVGQILKMSAISAKASQSRYAHLPPLKPTLAAPTLSRKTLPSPQNKPVYLTPPKKITYAKPKGWVWPTNGKVVLSFSKASGGNHGIEIAGKLGQPVIASAAGKVVYAGSGLRGYGNLVIIKHNDSYLSAYAYNKTLLVKEGSWVKTGQKISYMGQNNAGKVLLHFEIRRNGKPVNPLQFLS